MRLLGYFYTVPFLFFSSLPVGMRIVIFSNKDITCSDFLKIQKPDEKHCKSEDLSGFIAAVFSLEVKRKQLPLMALYQGAV